MSSLQLKQAFKQLHRLLSGPVLALLLLAVVACNAEATATPVPAPAPTATATTEPTATPAPTPTPTLEPTAEPYDGATAFAEYWNPPTGYYGEPVYGGTLRIAYQDPLEHANIWGASSGAAARFRVPTGANLVMENPYDPRGPMVPDLAKEWTIHDSLDGVTFHFREGVTWHNGEPFVCEDARFTFETMITERGITSSRMKHYLTHVVLEKMTCLDDLTLGVKFSDPTAIPLHPFAHRDALVFNKAWFLEGGEEAMFLDVNMGIGPFRWGEEGQYIWAEGQPDRDDEWRFERNHDYFIPELPYVDELVIHGMGDESASMGAMMAHLVDWLWHRDLLSDATPRTYNYETLTWDRHFPSTGFQNYVDHDQIVTVIGPTRGNLRLWINPRHRPFGNARIRQAIVMGIDRQTFIEEHAGGHAAVGGFGYAPGSTWELPRDQRCAVPGWCMSENMEASRAEAKAILEEEGFDFGKTYLFTVESDELMQARAAFLMDQLRLIGIKSELEEPFIFRLPPGAYHGWAEFMLTGSYTSADDPNLGVGPLLRCDSIYNFWTPQGFCDESVVALLDQARVELDPDKRLALAHEIELAAMKQYSSFPIYWEQEGAAFWPEVRGYVHFPSYTGSFLKFMHMWIDPARRDDTGYSGQTTGVPGGI